MIRYHVSLINRRLNMRKEFDVKADIALEAIKTAKGLDPAFDEVESCTLIEFLG